MTKFDFIYGLPESNDSNSANCNAANVASFSKLVSSQFCIENISIVKVTRLGRLNLEKPRPLLVNLSDSSSRKYLLQNARILRGNSEYNRVYISPDLSPKECELNKKLHMELKRRKQADETN